LSNIEELYNLLVAASTAVDQQIRTPKVDSHIGHDWARGRPKIRRIDEVENFEKYMIDDSCDKIGGERWSGYTVNRHVLDVAKEIQSPLEILESIAAAGYSFCTSGVISIDSTYEPLNLGLTNARITRPEVLILGDAIYPHTGYHLDVSPGTLTDADRRVFTRKFADFNAKSGNKIKQVTIDNGVEFQNIRNEFSSMFPGAEFQISHFHTDRYIDQMLPLFRQEREVKTVRRIVRSSLHEALETIGDEQELESVFKNLRISNAKVCDEQVEKVLDSLQPLCRNLTTYARLKTDVRSTNQVESINSVIKTRIDRMHGFKSFESAKLITNALCSFMLFRYFGRGAKYEGRRPIDLCFKPQLPGTWMTYCLRV